MVSLVYLRGYYLAAVIGFGFDNECYSTNSMEFQTTWTYAALDAVILLCAVSCGLAWRQQWLRSWYPTIRSVLFAGVPLMLWDIIAVHVGKWKFSERYTLSKTFLGLPVEEYIFLAVLCLLSLAIFQRLARDSRSKFISVWWLLLPILGASVLNIAFWGQGYPALVSIITLVVVTMLAGFGRPLLRYSWLWYEFVMLGTFTLWMVLRAQLLMVRYGVSGVTVVHLGGSPIEYPFYIFAFSNLVLLAYFWSSQNYS